MLKPIAATLAAASLIAAFTAPSPVRAEIRYPWCAQYSGRNASTNCGFVTIAQCRTTVSGVGGYCYENPAYSVAPSQPKRRRAPRS